jgi:membrane-bound lytic murein transglycosylase B
MTFRRIFAGAAMATALAAAVPTTAQAAPIQQCGNSVARGHWTNRPVEGEAMRNVTTRGVSCRWAHAFVYGVQASQTQRRQPNLRGVPVWTCRTRSTGYESADIRCTSGSHVVRWQVG